MSDLRRTIFRRTLRSPSAPDDSLSPTSSPSPQPDLSLSGSGFTPASSTGPQSASPTGRRGRSFFEFRNQNSSAKARGRSESADSHTSLTSTETAPIRAVEGEESGPGTPGTGAISSGAESPVPVASEEPVSTRRLSEGGQKWRAQVTAAVMARRTHSRSPTPQQANTPQRKRSSTTQANSGVETSTSTIGGNENVQASEGDINSGTHSANVSPTSSRKRQQSTTLNIGAPASASTTSVNRSNNSPKGWGAATNAVKAMQTLRLKGPTGKSMTPRSITVVRTPTSTGGENSSPGPGFFRESINLSQTRSRKKSVSFDGQGDGIDSDIPSSTAYGGGDDAASPPLTRPSPLHLNATFDNIYNADTPQSGADADDEVEEDQESSNLQGNPNNTMRSSMKRTLSPKGGDGLVNKVDYLISVAKTAYTFAQRLDGRLNTIRSGPQMLDNLRDTHADLRRQRDKVLAVYDTLEVKRSCERLEMTMSWVMGLLEDLEKANRMFGKKKAFGKRMQELVHDVGTNGNALLAATSLAIQDRPHMLYMVDSEKGGPPKNKQDELRQKCSEADRHYYGREGFPNMKTAFEAYSWCAERGYGDAMFMLSTMYSKGQFIEKDEEKAKEWLEKGAACDHPACMHELANLLLKEADDCEREWPEVIDLFNTRSTTLANREIKEIEESEFDDEQENEGLDEHSIYGDAEEKGDFSPDIRATSMGNANRSPTNKKNTSTSLRSPVLGVRDRNNLTANNLTATIDRSPRQNKAIESNSVWASPVGISRPACLRYTQCAQLRRRALTLLEDSSSLGHIEATASLGCLYESLGYIGAAKRCYISAAQPRNSADQPSSRAQTYLGNMYYTGRGVPQDMPSAVSWFKKAAKIGHPAACNNLGSCYEAGLGVERDIPKAIEMYRRAVEGGSLRACTSLAYLLARGALHTLSSLARQGYERDGDKPIELREVPFEDPRSGRMLDGDEAKSAAQATFNEMTNILAEACELFRRAAAGGIADASYQLGRLHLQGMGMPVDSSAAFEHFRHAADTGHITAAQCTASMLFSGIGCLACAQQAAKYYKIAAEGGDATSMNALGIMYEDGKGVDRSRTQAIMWYQKAAKAGSSDGAYNAGVLLETTDFAQLMANANESFSEHQLEGSCSDDLSGDLPAALAMYELAHQLGHKGAQKEVTRLRLRLRVDTAAQSMLNRSQESQYAHQENSTHGFRQ